MASGRNVFFLFVFCLTMRLYRTEIGLKSSKFIDHVLYYILRIVVVVINGHPSLGSACFGFPP